MTNIATRFNKITRDFSKSIGQDCVDNINAYWRLSVAHLGNDYQIHSDGHLVNGVPRIARDPTFSYKHEDIVHVRWENRNLQLTRRGR